MTYLLSFRAQAVGGAVIDPYLMVGDDPADPTALSIVPASRVPAIVAGRNLLFAAHGFNVSRNDGAVVLTTLGRYLAIPPPALFVALLWPGDAWIPIVDYPFEGGVAIDCGRRLAAWCDASCAGAQSLSFVSHSLGARLVLEAVARLKRKARSVCLAAGAINRDCLTAEYRAAAGNAEAIAILASREDYVLKVAYSAGDPFADILHDDHTPFVAALGAVGPPPPAAPPVASPWQIPNSEGYGHGDYLPAAGAIALPPAPDALWPRAADFMRRSFLGQTQTWPSG
jgi:hypothetical protein